jgi:hypothetical protein
MSQVSIIEGRSFMAAENDSSLPLSENEDISQRLKLSALSGFQQLRSREYIALVINFTIGCLASNFYIGSYLQQTRRLPATCTAGRTLVECDADKVELLHTSWSVIYPFGAIASPLFGIAMDRLQFRNSFVIVVLFSICHQVTNLIPVPNLQFVTYIMFACGRQIIFGFFYSSLGTLFGFEHYGLLTSVDSVIVTGLIYCNKLLADASESANSYLVSNVIFLAMTACLLLLRWFAFTWNVKSLDTIQEKLLPN